MLVPITSVVSVFPLTLVVISFPAKFKVFVPITSEVSAIPLMVSVKVFPERFKTLVFMIVPVPEFATPLIVEVIVFVELLKAFEFMILADALRPFSTLVIEFTELVNVC